MRGMLENHELRHLMSGPLPGEIAIVLLVALYAGVSGVLLVYTLNAWYMVVACLIHRQGLQRRNEESARRGVELLRSDADWPMVTTQIPLYNEINVAERVIEAAAAMDYPAGRHEIQVLDDSTDGTRALVDAVAARLREKGVWIEIVRRTNRTGYKAGALAEGMRRSHGEYLAIFDADFVPTRNFLRLTVPHLVARPEAGWVQGRWGHLNERESLLTRAQCVGLDGHFAVEQRVRSGREGLCMNFNGTAGIWRREAIVSSGGWKSDTLTEDLDLSYRAQFAGWKGIYLPDVVVPGELPSDVAAFKSQQFRWAKGSTQTALKLIPGIVRSRLPLVTKVQCWFHLTAYAIHPLLLTVAALSLPMAWLLPVRGISHGLTALWIAVPSLASFSFYFLGQRLLHKNWGRRMIRLPFFILAGIGLSLSNTVAVCEALAGKKSPFVRTPKAGGQGAHKTRGLHRYKARVTVPVLGELVCGLLCFLAFALAWRHGCAMAVQFLLVTGAGFFFLVFSSFDLRKKPKAEPASEPGLEPSLESLSEPVLKPVPESVLD